MVNRFPRCRSDDNKNVSTEKRNFYVKRFRKGKKPLQKPKYSRSKRK